MGSRKGVEERPRRKRWRVAGVVKRFEGEVDGDEGDEGGDVVAAVVDDDVNDCVAAPTWRAAWPTRIEADTY